MSASELQQEEAEVLKAIFDGDDCFKVLNDTTFQYKIAYEDQPHKNFMVEVKWTADYPNALPEINLNAFYNNHILAEVKQAIITTLNEQAQDWLGSAMTYTIFTYAKENGEELMSEQPQKVFSESTISTTAPAQSLAVKKERKEQLSKSQKRKIVNRLDNKGELPRGWNWVDVVKHLSQTGVTSQT